MLTYNYELGPTSSHLSRQERAKLIVTGTLVARNYGTATQLASEKAREISKERRMEYGLVRLW